MQRTRTGAGNRGGFTILEVLIAVAILVIGLLGILALFPAAIFSGKRSIEDTTAVLVAQSIEQAIREGIQHRKGQTSDGRWTYFLLQHDGVQDPIPRRIGEAKPGEDYYILLPADDTERGSSAMERAAAYEVGKVFIYPETDGKEWIESYPGASSQSREDESSSASPNGGGDPLAADDDRDDVPLDRLSDVNDADERIWRGIWKTYPLGGQVRAEKLAGGLEWSDLTPDQQQALDTMSDYSYAFAIRRAFNDASLADHYPQTMGRLAKTDNKIVPGNELYEVYVMVFRSFRPVGDQRKPVYTSRFLVHK